MFQITLWLARPFNFIRRIFFSKNKNIFPAMAPFLLKHLIDLQGA